jgi:hypothetical protein
LVPLSWIYLPSRRYFAEHLSSSHKNLMKIAYNLYENNLILIYFRYKNSFYIST